MPDTQKKSVRRIKYEMRHKKLVSHDKAFLKKHRFIAGLDEAGMGALAGPVVAGCVILHKHSAFDFMEGIYDSKSLNQQDREDWYGIIRFNCAVGWGIGAATAQEIDQLNIRQANFLAMRRAILQAHRKLPVHVYPTEVHCLVDGFDLPDDELAPSRSQIIKGDTKSLAIAAASILAKVARDWEMEKIDKRWPEYKFGKHKGYPTPEHIEILAKHKPCPGIHRRTYGPVKKYL